MRCQFTAGVLDFFMDQKLFCERVIGVSAGCAVRLQLRGRRRRAHVHHNTKYCDDWRYLSMKSFSAHRQRLRALSSLSTRSPTAWSRSATPGSTSRPCS